MELKSASKRSNQMKKNEGNIKRQSKSYPVGTLLTDAITQHSENSVSDCEKVERVSRNSNFKKADESKFVWCKTSAESRDDEVTCEVSRAADATDTQETLSLLSSKLSPSTISDPISGKTTLDEISEMVEEISSKIQTPTLTSERLDRIRKYFAESRLLTQYESAFEWISKNVKSIYKDPVKSCGRLRVAVGNRSIPVDIAVKSLRMFVQNHTILEVDMMKHCFFEGRSEITMNELSEMLKRLMKMKIKHILFNNSDLSSAVLVRNSSDVSEVRNHYFQQKH